MSPFAAPEIIRQFLSTPSARRATAIKAYSYAKDGFLSTPSARRATPPGQVQQIRHVDFYPRPPRGGRPATALHRGKAAVFLSTPSARRATFWRFRNGLCDEISIHALREEGDAVGKDLYLCAFKFLSTPSARRATCPYKHPGSVCAISIHALREEGDIQAYRA